MSIIPDEIGREIAGSERVLWSGQPRQGVVFRGADVFLVPFSLLWCGFAVFWEWSVLQAPKAPAIFPLFGIPFVVIGLYFVIGRFFAEAKQRSRTFYAVTNERVLIISGLLARRIKSISLRTLSDLALSESSDGKGTITFGGGSQFASMFGGMSSWPGAEAYMGPRFDLISDARSVFDIIRKAQSASV
jgi:hypothetical protein